jgi:hypothetical protein
MSYKDYSFFTNRPETEIDYLVDDKTKLVIVFSNEDEELDITFENKEAYESFKKQMKLIFRSI